MEGTRVIVHLLTRVVHLLTHVSREHGRNRVHRVHATHSREHLLRTVHATHSRDHAAVALEHSTTNILPLVVVDIERLAMEELTLDLADSISSSFGSSEIAEAKALAHTSGSKHDLDALDLTVLAEELTKIIVSDRIIKVLDVQVSLGAGSVVKGTLVLLSAHTLTLLLGTIDIEGLDNKAILLKVFLILLFSFGTNQGFILPFHDLLVQSLLSLDGIFVLLKIDETEATALTRVLVLHDYRRSDLAELREHLLEIRSVELLANVLDVNIGVCFVGIVATKVLGNELLNNDVLTKTLEGLLVILDSLESLLRILGLIELNETIAKASTIILGNNLAGGDSTELREDILKLDESHRAVKRLDEKVTLVALTLRGITTGPHDTAGLALKTCAIESIESLLCMLRGLEVDVGIAERMLILHITANTDGQDGTTLLESFVDVLLSDVGKKITNVEGTTGEGGGDRGRLLSRHCSD